MATFPLPMVQNPADEAICTVRSCSRLDVEIIEVTWLDGHDAAREDVTIKAPHWQKSYTLYPVLVKSSFLDPIDLVNNENNDPASFHYATGAKKAAVYEISSSASFRNPRVRVKLKTVVGQMFSQSDVAYTILLQMSLGKLTFNVKGFTLPSLNGIATVTLELSTESRDKVINKLQTVSGDAIWQVSKASSKKYFVLKNQTRLEVFFIYAKPAAFYGKGVWIEALRFLFRNVAVQGDSALVTTARKIATYCHIGHGLTYDTTQGAPAYGVHALGGGFDLKKYLKRSAGNVVNCYDQAAAVQALCGALGISTTWIHLSPHGFINITFLVGVGLCNNPFFANSRFSPYPIAVMQIPLQLNVYSNAPICTDGRVRSGFARHSFIKLNDNNHIIDACAGPALATESLAGYKASTIDAACNSLTSTVTGVANELGSVSGVNW